jgi:hypothetical protein
LCRPFFNSFLIYYLSTILKKHENTRADVPGQFLGLQDVLMSQRPFQRRLHFPQN